MVVNASRREKDEPSLHSLCTTTFPEENLKARSRPVDVEMFTGGSRQMHHNRKRMKVVGAKTFLFCSLHVSSSCRSTTFCVPGTCTRTEHHVFKGLNLSIYETKELVNGHRQPNTVAEETKLAGRTPPSHNL